MPTIKTGLTALGETDVPHSDRQRAGQAFDCRRLVDELNVNDRESVLTMLLG